MCRNIRALYNVDPPATDAEIRDASLQFVRKISGFPRPSRANEASFDFAVDRIAGEARRLLDSLVTTARPRDRARDAARAKALAADQYRSAAATRE